VYTAENAPGYGCASCVMLSVTLTQHNTQHQVNIRKLISECFYKCDFSKEQCSSLKMILGSKHVGAILSVLM